MPQSWNDIRERATRFSHDWKHDEYEKGEAQTFWNEFFDVFGIRRRRVAAFEKQVRKLNDQSGYIDCFWPGTLIAEHKSKGKDLDSAFVQALDYLEGIKDHEFPQYIVVSDFQRIRLYDLDKDEEVEFTLDEFPQKIKLFGFVAGYKPQVLQPEDPVNIKAAEKMGRLHDQLKESGYQGHELEVLLVRLLFLLFADDTGIFQPNQAFQQWLEERTGEDGADLGAKLAHAFQVLNTPEDRRNKNLDEELAAFPHINGSLFDETLRIAAFTRQMRGVLIDACTLDWSQISPAVFGAMFQSIMDKKARRDLGAHYTSEANIEKLIRPLFLDGLWLEFERIKRNKHKLEEFHEKLRRLQFLDPACGCGNFLVVTYKRLRELELEVLRAKTETGQQVMDVQDLIKLDVDQFFGIEIEEFPARIAEVALWLTDHQMNLQVGAEFGLYFARIPLRSQPHIHHANALQINWEDVAAKDKLDYIIGNPPFSGAMVMTDQARSDMRRVLADIKGSGVLDFVACWYWLAAQYVAGTNIRVALVSTNSITQGEQVRLLWQPILSSLALHIQFCHRTFRWTNEAKGKAAVHCVIVGFGSQTIENPIIFDYESVASEPTARVVGEINAYLVEGDQIFLPNRSDPLCASPPMRFGSMPRDGGFLSLTPEERADLVARDPDIEPFVLKYVGSREFFNDIERYCLWLVDAPTSVLANCEETKKRIQNVRTFREGSKARSTREFARTPGLFCQIAQPSSEYLLVPRVSSARRTYVPFGYFGRDVIASDATLTVEGASLYEFGVMSSTMHMAWMRYTCGRLKSDFRYSKDVVYNNYPWPVSVPNQRRSLIANAAQQVLDARNQDDGTLAQKYDPLLMPKSLLQAHRILDREVDLAYTRKKLSGDADRILFLFDQYRQLSRPLGL